MQIGKYHVRVTAYNYILEEPTLDKETGEQKIDKKGEPIWKTVGYYGRLSHLLAKIGWLREQGLVETAVNLEALASASEGLWDAMCDSVDVTWDQWLAKDELIEKLQAEISELRGS